MKDVTLRTDELADFSTALERLLGAVTGTATLEHFEEEVGMKITLEHGRGTLAAFVQNHYGTRLDALIDTDQSFLRASAVDFRAIVRDFPVCGDAYA